MSTGNMQANLLITGTLPLSAPLSVRETSIMVNDPLSPNNTVELIIPQRPKRSTGRRPILSDSEPQNYTEFVKISHLYFISTMQDMPVQN